MIKYLVSTNQGFYFFSNDTGYGLTTLKELADQYDLVEVLKIKREHPTWDLEFEVAS